MNRPTCISLEALRTLGPETITKLASALSIEAKAKAALESATAHVDHLFSEIALSISAPVVEVPVIDAAPIALTPRPQDRSQEAAMPLASPFLAVDTIPSASAVAEAEAAPVEVSPEPPVVAPAPEEVSLPSSGAQLPQHPSTASRTETMKARFEAEAARNGWLTTGQAAERLGVSESAIGQAVRAGRLSQVRKGAPGGKPAMFDPAEIERYAVARVDAKRQAIAVIVKPKPVVDLGPTFEREGEAHYDAIEQGKRKAEAEKWESFYITFDPKSGDVSYVRGRGQATGLNLVERWEKSRGGIWDSQPMGKGLDGAMGAHMHTGAIGARVLA